MRKSFKVLIAVILILATCCVTAAAYTKNSKNVTLSLYGDGNEIRPTYANTVFEFLEENKITLNYGDIVSPALDTAIGKETKIDVEKGSTVTVYIDKTPVYVSTNAQTVGELMDELQKSGSLTEKYLLADLSDAEQITSGMEIFVSSMIENTYYITKEIPFQTVTAFNNTLPVAHEAVIQEGKSGYREIIVKELIIEGEVISSDLIESKILKDPVDCIIEKGSANALIVDNQTIAYKDSFTVTATGYSRMQANLSDYTYTGVLAERGVIAVDPSVIPLGTKVYIEGYGFASCEDTGGAIKGTKIDLCFDTVEECYQWGVQDVKIYILE
jgi:3D (Asp-Asp-Asp) domain-containing protein